MLLFEVNVTLEQSLRECEEFKHIESFKSYSEINEAVNGLNNKFTRTIYSESKNNVFIIFFDRGTEEFKLNLYALYALENEVFNMKNIVSTVENYVREIIDLSLDINTGIELDIRLERLRKIEVIDRFLNYDCSSVLRNITNIENNRSKSYCYYAEAEDVHPSKIKHIDLLEAYSNEMKRITKNKFKSFHGHPVHYIFRYEERNTTIPIIVNALYENNRLVTNHINFIDLLGIGPNGLEKVYRVATGHTLVLEFSKIETSENESMSRNSDTIKSAVVAKAMELSRIYSDTVLTIICLKHPADLDIILGMAKDADVNFIPLLPNNINGLDKVKQYLNSRAKSDGFRKFTGDVADTVYTPTDLNNIYNTWKKEYLFESMGYNKKSSTGIVSIKHDPMGRLNNMIGLQNVKATVSQILSYFKMQKVYLDKGVATSVPCRHMVFYGNPGTAKTTIARLIGEILKQNGIMTNGKVVEVGRSQLVGMYVGHTAVTTKKKIREAKGGILFIDEAYSLVDKNSNSFGDEAINTLVQEMDNVREDTIIILAGYPDKMEAFMDTNPGIRSRIGFHVKFDNYSKDELMKILTNMARKEKFTLTKEALAFAEKEITAAMSTKDFGNGRFVRTLLEQAIMKQATRIAQDDKYMDMSTEDIFTIEHEDLSNMNKSLEKPRLGFSV